MLEGEPVHFASPLEAQHAGISTVYQEVNLCPNLSVAENIYIGREPRRLGRDPVARDAPARRPRRSSASTSTSTSRRSLSTHSLAVQQMVAIARAIDISAEVLILDEPTSSLDGGEVEQLFAVMRQLAREGIAIVFVSHFLDQVYEIADRMTVLRNGRLVGEWTAAELSRVELVDEDDRPRARDAGGARAEAARRAGRARGRRRPCSRPRRSGGRARSRRSTSRSIRGEVVGLAGLLGSGRTEVARLLFGADRADSGELAVDGRAGHDPEPAGRDGATASRSAPRTAGRKGWSRTSPCGRTSSSRCRPRAAGRARSRASARTSSSSTTSGRCDIRPAEPEQPVRNLSGGNQQKVLLARWLITEPKLLILDEPTRGIDVGAKTEIQRLVVSLCDDGMSVLFISAELEEVLRLSHKVAVLRDRQLVAELANDGTSRSTRSCTRSRAERPHDARRIA